MIGNDPQIQTLHTLANQAHIRHQVISQNLANLNTPGYLAIDVAFDTQLDAAKGGTMGAIKPHLHQISGSIPRQDGNNVDLDLELGKLQSNNLMHQTFVHVLASQFGMMRTAITGT